MNIKTFKLINGEELIADIKSLDTTHIHAENVVVLQVMAHPETGRPIQSFCNWPALAKQDQVMIIPLTAVMSYPADVHEELERQYLSSVTGLELPPATPKILLG
jgi:hypothetical protein